MLCAVTFEDGRVHFKSKFVNSEHRQEEAAKQKFLYHGQMGTKPSSTSTFRYLINTLKNTPMKFRNPSNTNSFYWGGKVWHLMVVVIDYSASLKQLFLLPYLVIGIDMGQVYPRRVFSGFIKINNVFTFRVFNFEMRMFIQMPSIDIFLIGTPQTHNF